MRPTLTRSGTTEAITRDSWDRDGYARALERIPVLADAVKVVTEANPYGADAVADLWAALLKAAPGQPPVDAMRPTHVPNHAVAGEVLAADAVRDLRRYTVGNEVSAAMACVSFASHLAEMSTRLAPAAEQAEAAQAAADALDDFLDGRDPGDLDADEADELADLQAAADAAGADLADAMADAGPSVGRFVRAGLGDALADADDAAAAMAGMGLDPGDVSRMDPSSRLRLATRMAANPVLRDIARMMGAQYNLARSERTARTKLLPDERKGEVLGNDLNRVFASELAALAVPELEDSFYDRWARRQLLCHDTEGDERLGLGAIVAVLDGSGTMHGGDGRRHRFAKAFAGALMLIARDENRAFCAIEFGGPDQSRRFEFPDPASFDPHRILDFFEFHFTGAGTCFETALDEAVSVIEAEHMVTGRSNADVAFVTDGQARVSDAWMQSWHATKERLGFQIHGVAIDVPVDAEPFASICDRRVVPLYDLVAGNDAHKVYRALH